MKPVLQRVPALVSTISAPKALRIAVGLGLGLAAGAATVACGNGGSSAPTASAPPNGAAVESNTESCKYASNEDVATAVGVDIVSASFFPHVNNETGSCTYVPEPTASPRVSVNIETFHGDGDSLRAELHDWEPCSPLSAPVGLESYGCPGNEAGVSGARVFVLYKPDRYFMIGSQSVPAQAGQSIVDEYGRLAAKVVQNVQ